MSEVSTQTLYVVARELNNELNDARVALELFGEQQDQVEVLAKCRTHLRQVRGALRLVEVFGAALLVEEMEQLAQYLIDHIAEQRHLAEGLDALMRAMVQLPTYLERVLGGGRDMALVLLPLLNDLRAVRGNPLLSEGTLLLLNLSSDQQASPVTPAPGEAAVSVGQWARKMRTRFQLGLLGWIKGERIDQNLEILARTAEKMEQVATKQPVFQLWWVVGAVVEALRDKGLEGTASVKRLLGQADRQLKRLYEQGEQHYCDQPPLDLLNNLLYYVARATSNGPKVTAVRASFRLHELLPVDEQVEAARESLSAPSIKLMKTVAGAIKEDLARVKDALDIYVRRGGTQLDELAPQLELLKKIGDTLGVLGLGELRERVQQQTTHLQTLLQAGTQPDDTSLMAMAATLINVEDSLDEQLVGLIMPSTAVTHDASGEPASLDKTADKDVEFRQVSEAVLRECIVNMARIKEAIALALEKPGEAQALDQIPHLMRGITAGLLMLGKARAVEVSERIRKALARYARPDSAPQMSEKMDRLADAIVAVEYYLETLQAGRSDPWYMLDNAESCLRVLDDLSNAGATGLQHIPQLLPDNTPVEATLALTPRADLYDERAHDVERTLVLGAAANQLFMGGSDRPGNDKASVNQSGLNQSAQKDLPPVLVRPQDKTDPEFLELFIEEARDEIAKLNVMLPRWDDNPLDQDALINLRRSFHTLKGSGRLVGAQLIGEFAWSIEGLLNRIISQTLERSPEMMELFRQAVAMLPQLVEQLEVGHPAEVDVAPLIHQAHALSGGREHGRQPLNTSATGTRPALALSDEQLHDDTAAQEAVNTAVVDTQVEAPLQQSMDSTLHEIFAKEVAGHIAEIREYVASCDNVLPPYAVSEALHRACHTLSGASKTAGARHSIRIAEPLNHYVRKLYDNGAALPADGLQILKEAVAAIESILANVTENTQFFNSQADIVDRLQRLEQRLDSELTTRNVMHDATGVLSAPPFINDPATALDALSNFSGEAAEYLSANERAGAPLENNHVDAGVAIEISNDVDHGSEFGDDEDEQWIDLTTDDLQKLLSQPLATILAQPEAAIEAEAIVLESPTEIAVSDGQELFIDETMQAEAEAVPIDELQPQTIVETTAWAANFTPPVLDDLSVASTSEDQATAPSVPQWITDIQATEQQEQIVPESIGNNDTSVADAAAPTWPPFANNQFLHKAPTTSNAEVDMAEVDMDDDMDQGMDEDFDADVAAIFTEEATELLESADNSLRGWQGDRSNSHHVYELKRALHTLKGGARMAGIRAMGDLSHELESFMELIELGSVPASNDVFELLQTSLDALNHMRDAVNDGRRAKSASYLIQRIQALGRGQVLPVIPSMPLHSMPSVAATPMADTTEASSEERIDEPAFTVQAEASAASPEELPTSIDTASNDNIAAPELVSEQVILETDAEPPSFVFELSEEQPSLAALDDASENNGAATDVDFNISPAQLDDIQRSESGEDSTITANENDAHEVAAEFGGDDLVGDSYAPFIAPPIESTIDYELPDTLQVPSLVFAEVESVVVQPEPIADHLVTNNYVSSEPPTLSEIVAAGAPEVDLPSPQVETNAEPQAAASFTGALPPGRMQATQERGEVARVDAELLDNLLNNAGEVSILRSRLEQQVSSLEFNLSELGRTVTRLKDQLRKLEIETEAQILHKHQDDSKGREDFDPLELDRYSTIQQFSRALAESVSDVDSIEGLLETMTREAQNLLLQQSRVVTELQNGLMKTRMVPFSRHAQRLTRLVRQVATDIGKRAELSISGAGGELDRQVLERMLPPFEHMLRNSVVHGIETPAERLSLGKPEAGSIQVSLRREGTEMVITLQDDGRGIDVNAVREKARAKGLIPGDRILTDEEALQLILEPGFSTATTITQHAGRGVGMDVVVTEIKKLGGALFTESKAGEGVKFTIRLPFTLAISQSLLVRVGENEMYALPLPSVEGVVRLPRAEVEAHLNQEAPSFDYGGQLYKFQHLGAFIDAGPSELPDGEVPIILIKAGEHSTALVTDELIGNREIVVKSVGPQVSSIRGIAGATILGDGRVVIILDMGALVRSEWRERPASDMAARGEDRRTFVLVVDDSITVRRVTQRLLERHGMRVLTAKDGIDALEILQEHLPDIILLDIEMPRMDGYELATHVRADQRLADIPIVMITSRVSEKHRARAIEIGVNDYLGKPYQENQLLDAIEPLVQSRRRKQAVI